MIRVYFVLSEQRLFFAGDNAEVDNETTTIRFGIISALGHMLLAAVRMLC